MEKSKLPNGGILTVSGGVDLVKKGGLALYILTRESYQEINYKFTAAEVSILVLRRNCDKKIVLYSL